MTAVRITTPGRQALSAAADCANQLQGFAMVQGDEHLIEVEIDHGASGQRRDLRPLLPLIMRW
ncbi:hypothetical protein C3F00_044935 [Pseudomonas sp. MWU13-2860]|nr:hypothetical protein C3F00_044935 [Pseudomonas sp. MWU13-2860]